MSFLNSYLIICTDGSKSIITLSQALKINSLPDSKKGDIQSIRLIKTLNELRECKLEILGILD